ncbi:MAG: hypothetical protein K9M82_02580 [Deltaproteobacteria bacterium]|nr:hypothetical protein [Deltaproteobacteria bacterium]
MDRTLFDRKGRPAAYLRDDYHGSVYLWDGHAVAYIHEYVHVYGINGRHLGWLIDDVLYTNEGERIGFTSLTCPVPVGREPAKTERRSVDKIRPRWKAPATPKLGYRFAERDLAEFLAEGGAPPLDAGGEDGSS